MCVCVCYSGSVLFVCSKVCHTTVFLLCVMSVYLSVFVSEEVHTVFTNAYQTLSCIIVLSLLGGPNHFNSLFRTFCEALDYRSQSMIKYSVLKLPWLLIAFYCLLGDLGLW